MGSECCCSLDYLFGAFVAQRRTGIKYFSALIIYLRINSVDGLLRVLKSTRFQARMYVQCIRMEVKVTPQKKRRQCTYSRMMCFRATTSQHDTTGTLTHTDCRSVVRPDACKRLLIQSRGDRRRPGIHKYSLIRKSVQKQ